MSLKLLTLRFVPILAVGAVGLSTPWRLVMSRCLNQTGQSYDISCAAVRSLFADSPVLSIEPCTGHPHGAAAADRSMGSYFIEKFGRDMSRNVWYYQCSNADYRNNRLGSREWFWMKDVAVPPGCFNPGDEDMQALVDVDQYVDMPSFLLRHFRPTILYTFQPSKVAHDAGEFNYTFNANNEVIYRVGGGAEYKHKVWNYDTDVIMVSGLFAGKSWFKFWNWVPFVTAAYQIDKRQMDDHHQIVMLTPVKRWFFLAALLARCLYGKTLKRFMVHQNGFLRLTTQRHDGMYTSTGLPNSLLCGELKSADDATLASLARSTKSGLTMAHVRKLMPEDHNGAAVVYEYHAQKLPEMSIVTYSGVGRDHVRGFQYVSNTNEYDSDAKQSMVSFMSPIINGGFCPDLTVGNGQQAIEGRIERVKSTSTLTKFLEKTIDEFVTLMYKEAGVGKHTLDPVEPEIVYERQSKPNQRRILELAEFVEGKREGKSFIKREAYMKVTDPRIITTINGSDKYRYSRYIYAFSDYVLKEVSWYAFGKTPFEISMRVVEVASKANSLSNTDFSRFDGTLSEVPRLLEKRIMAYGFRSCHRSDLIELQRSQQNMVCYLGVNGNSIKYESGLARASGSPETSAFNSIVNGFCAYLAWRMTKVDGNYVDQLTAYNSLGVYGGDDGLTPDVPPNTYKKAASKLGLRLDIEPVYRGAAGVKFLNRHYGPYVWYGDLNSMCDVKRALMKFHLTVSMPPNISAVEKLKDKAYAYYLSDGYTPIIGRFTTAVVDHMEEDYVFRNLNSTWTAQFATDVQYPNFDILPDGTCVTPSWMYEVTEEMFDFRFDLFNDWLGMANNIEYFLSPPNNLVETPEVVASVPVVMEGDFVEPITSVNKIPGKPVISKRRRGGRKHRDGRRDSSKVSFKK